MHHTGTQTTAYGAGLAGIGRVNKLNPDIGSLRFISNKGLQLRPGPSMEPGAYPFTGLDPFANIGQVLHGDGAAFVSYCFRNNSLADFVVDMVYMPGFAAGDFLQQLSCRLRAVALKPGTKSKVSVAVMSQLAATEYLSGADSGDGVLPKVHPGGRAGGSCRRIGEIEHQIEVIPILLPYKLRFFGEACSEKIILELSLFHRDDNSPLGSKQGERIPLDAVGTLVEVNGAGRLEVDQGPVGISQIRIVGKEGFVRLNHGSNGIAGHLGAKGRNGFSHTVVSNVVQFDSVAASVGHSCTSQIVTCPGKLRLQQGQSRFLFWRCDQLYADGSFHSAPSFDMFSPLDVPLNRFRTGIPGSADIIGRRPKAPVPQRLFQVRESHKQFSGRDPFQQLDCGSHRICRRDRNKQVDMVRLDFQGKDIPSMLGTNVLQQVFKHTGYLTRQDRLAELGTPHHMVSGLIDAVPAISIFNHIHIIRTNKPIVNSRRFLPRLKSGVSAPEVL